MRNEMLPVVIGKINDSYMTPNSEPTQPFIETVHSAQKKYTGEDDCATYVIDIESYNFSDPWHYDTEGFISMGIAFANAVEQLEKECLKDH